MSEPESQIRNSEPGARQLWPVFICYRQVDGLPAARRLHELLDKRLVTGPGGEQIELDVYLDQTMPAVADWRALHRPYLERARALLVVCSPGAKINEGPNDWVHREIDWWLEHRTVGPILIDPLRQGQRYVPDAINTRWPEAQRIPLVESEWAHLAAVELAQKAEALRRQIVGVVLPSGATIYTRELDAERQRVEQLGNALRRLGVAVAALVLLLFLVAGAAYYAIEQRKEAALNQSVSQAALYDAEAASAFNEAWGHEVRWERARQRQLELKRSRDALPSTGSSSLALRRQNLDYEIRQLDDLLAQLSANINIPRQRGLAKLELAENAWKELRQGRKAQIADLRTAPERPDIFSIELIKVGGGESILIHYGPVGATRLVLINAGPGAIFKNTVGKRLQELKRFGNAPPPIELFVVSDQDEQKTGGLHRLLDDRAAAGPSERIADLRMVWVNIFDAFGIRGDIRRLMQQLNVPLNAPFDHLVARPDSGQFKYKLPGDLEIFVLGPDLARLRALYDVTRRRDKQQLEMDRKPLVPVVDSFPEERFSRLKLFQDIQRLPPPPVVDNDRGCAPSGNANALANVALTDRSLPNLASIVLLFRYRNKTFLHTGDSRADLILEALVSSKLMDRDGKAHVNLLHLPHFGSNNNLSPEFLERVTADEYLFSGDGTFLNPKIETIAALIAARPCARYTMYFVNRDSSETGQAKNSASAVTHAQKLDAFFAAEESFGPKYSRIFGASDRGSEIIDLLDRVTY
jgi:hypothetical protein